MSGIGHGGFTFQLFDFQPLGVIFERCNIPLSLLNEHFSLPGLKLAVRHRVLTHVTPLVHRLCMFEHAFRGCEVRFRDL